MNINKFKKYQFQIDGKTISYLQSGKGPTILFLHGLGIGTNIWNYVIPYLSNKHTIILLDLPGYGLNKDLFINPKFNDLTKFISDFIEREKSIEYLVGYSISGALSYRIAQKPPSSLKKIICVSTPIFKSSSIVLLNWVFRIIGSNLFITKIVKFLIVRFPIKHLIFLLGGLASVTNPKAMNECMRKFGVNTNLSYIFTFASTIFLPTQFAPIIIPAKYIYGERDGFATPQNYLESNNFYIIKGAYHLLPLEKPMELARLIEKVIMLNL